MPEPIDTIKSIIVAVAAIQGRSSKSLTQGDDFGLPRLIPANDDGSSIQITAEIDGLITSLADDLKSLQPSLSRFVKDKEWRNWVRSAIGPLIVSNSLTISAATNVLNCLNIRLKELVDNLVTREYAFGNTLFSNTDIPPFMIGPVKFEQRKIWLDRKVSERDVTTISQRRIKRHWAGKRNKPRKSNREQMREDDINKAIGNCPYVCSVKLSPLFAPEAGLETALTAARLALACVSLVYEQPSKAMIGFNLHYDGPNFIQKALLYIPGKVVINGSKLHHHPSGPQHSTSDWIADQQRFADTFSAAGEVLNCFVNPAGGGARAPVLGSLFQSLLWFERGCREKDDLMAIVALAASLDAIGKGTKVVGILKVLEARLGIFATTLVYANGPSFKSLLDKIYSEGRSRTIHGTSEKIGFDWEKTRNLAELIARITLIACLDYIAKTPSAVGPDDLKR